jgi:hypothetical protein
MRIKKLRKLQKMFSWVHISGRMISFSAIIMQGVDLPFKRTWTPVLFGGLINAPFSYSFLLHPYQEMAM